MTATELVYKKSGGWETGVYRSTRVVNVIALVVNITVLTRSVNRQLYSCNKATMFFLTAQGTTLFCSRPKDLSPTHSEGHSVTPENEIARSDWDGIERRGERHLGGAEMMHWHPSMHARKREGEERE